MVYINDRNVLCQIREAAIVPVVVLDDAKDEMCIRDRLCTTDGAVCTSSGGAYSPDSN